MIKDQLKKNLKYQSEIKVKLKGRIFNFLYFFLTLKQRRLLSNNLPN